MSGRAPWPVLAALILLSTAAGLRVFAATRPGLWADEVFSLAMATGHSLEHPAADANPSLGDFVQPPEARPAGWFRHYAEADPPAAGPGRVVRAVLLSDTSPPLYYLLLHLWTRGPGTSDAALRLFSVLWAASCLPLFWLVGRAVCDGRAGWWAALLFAFSPVAFYYSVEGRMYSMLWCLALALTWLTLRLARDGGRRHAALWVVAGTAGLLTHYFFAFVWLASAVWLASGDRVARRRAFLLAGITALLVLPWYVQVPASLARWRVSGDWLVGALEWPGALVRPLSLAAGLFAGGSDLGGWRWSGGLLVALGAAVLLAMLRGDRARMLISRPALLLWATLLAACAGPLVFDLLRQTTTSSIPRYVLAGLPAAMLLAAFAMSLLPRRLSVAALALVILAWVPGTWRVVKTRVPRPGQPYPVLAARLGAWAGPQDVVLVRSTPSGVVGLARYLREDIALVSWVTQLGTRRVPADLERILRGRRRMALVTVHALGSTDPVEPWLRDHARLLGRETFRHSSAELLYFAPAAGDTFFPPDVAMRRD